MGILQEYCEDVLKSRKWLISGDRKKVDRSA